MPTREAQLVCPPSVTDAAVIRCEDADLGYGSHRVLQGVTVDVRHGELLGIIGPNGAGKTTLLRGMMGILRPLRGRIEVSLGADGAPLRFGYVAQSGDVDLAYPLSALDVVLLGRTARLGVLRRFGRADREAAQAALAYVGGIPNPHRLFAELSGGQRQRVLLARALVSEPDILVLDEPTSDLDVRAQGEFLDRLERLRDERRLTVLLVSHLVEEVARRSSRALVIEDGRVHVVRTEGGEGAAAGLRQAILRQVCVSPAQ